MAKLIRILAASLGGGLVLGAGIRLGEQLAGQRSGGGATDKLSDRLGKLEGRLSHLETSAGSALPVGGTEAGGPLSGIELRMEAQEAEVSAVRVRLEAGARQAESLGQTSERLRAELRGWVDERVDERLRGVEAKLRTESDEAQREMLSAVIESVQTRVIGRISKLEEEVAGQAAGMNELRDCTLRTEQSMQKLLGGIDRLIAAQPVKRENLPEPEAARTPAEPLTETRPPSEAPKKYGEAGTSEPRRQSRGAKSGILNLNEPETEAGRVDAPTGGKTTPRRRWSIFG